MNRTLGTGSFGWAAAAFLEATPSGAAAPPDPTLFEVYGLPDALGPPPPRAPES